MRPPLSPRRSTRDANTHPVADRDRRAFLNPRDVPLVVRETEGARPLDVHLLRVVRPRHVAAAAGLDVGRRRGRGWRRRCRWCWRRRRRRRCRRRRRRRRLRRRGRHRRVGRRGWCRRRRWPEASAEPVGPHRTSRKYHELRSPRSRASAARIRSASWRRRSASRAQPVGFRAQHVLGRRLRSLVRGRHDRRGGLRLCDSRRLRRVRLHRISLPRRRTSPRCRRAAPGARAAPTRAPARSSGAGAREDAARVPPAIRRWPPAQSARRLASVVSSASAETYTRRSPHTSTARSSQQCSRSARTCADTHHTAG